MVRFSTAAENDQFANSFNWVMALIGDVEMLTLVLCVLCFGASKAYFLIDRKVEVTLDAEKGFIGWEGATYNPIRTWGRDPVKEANFQQGNRKDSIQSSSNQSRWWVYILVIRRGLFVYSQDRATFVEAS